MSDKLSGLSRKTGASPAILICFSVCALLRVLGNNKTAGRNLQTLGSRAPPGGKS